MHSPPNQLNGLVHLPTRKVDALPSAVSYRPSRFNAHTIADDGNLLLYNSLKGNFCAIPRKHVTEAEHHLSAQGTSAPLTPLGQYLENKGFIVPVAVDEDARWDVRYGIDQFRQDRLELTLLSSEDCNFRCIYCSQEFKRGSMRPEVREGVRRFVLSQIKKLSVLQIGWFGGEPLLGFDAIEDLAPDLQSVAAKHGVTYNAGMTTNGYLLTEERSRTLLSWGINHFQITLDGAALEHDSHRPLSSGERTFDTIVANLYALKSHKATFEVALRCNFDQTNIESIQRLLKELRDLVSNDSRFVLRFRPIGKWGGPHDDDLSVCGIKEASQQYVQLQASATKAGLSTEPLEGGLVPGPTSVCYAARPYSLIIGADGKVMKCTVVLDTDVRNVVGLLSSDGRVLYDEDRFALWTRPYYRQDAMCNKCFFVPVCQGVICPLPRITLGTRECPAQKVEIQQTLKDIYYLQRVKAAGAITSQAVTAM